MDKNFKVKVKDFFRKEGFYIALFLCICIIATVTAISYKVSNKNEVKNEVEQSKDEDQLSLNEDENITKEIPNAQRVEDDTNVDEELAKADENQETASVNAVAEVNFTKPVEGTVCREFSTTPIKYYETEDRVTYKTVNGIDIKAAIGTDVKSAAEGVVESVTNDPSQLGVEDGVNVIILHPNGLRTKYSNLDSNVSVNVGDKVTSDTVLGKVGATAALFKNGFDEHLNLQVIDANGNQVNPLDYIVY